MVKRVTKSSAARSWHGVERLEDRELLTTLLEGLAPNDLSGTTVTPVGNIFDDSPAGIVGDDFAISAPRARGDAGDVYIIFGGPHLDPQPPTQQGCINPPTRAANCNLINNLLTSRVALRILGARAGDMAGFSVAGVGNAIGDARPDVLVGAPRALNSAGVSSGRAYLIGGEVIANAISTARTIGGNAVATIDLNSVQANCTATPTVTIRCFDGTAEDDQVGASVAGLGLGHFIIGAPGQGAAPKEERGAVYVFAPLRGVTGGAQLSQISTVLGPSLNAHLGGVPVGELTTTNFRGYSVSGVRNPALIAVANEAPNDPRYDVLGGFEPDVLVGAPDACVFDACTLTDADPSTPAPDPEQRNGRVYLLSGTALITIGGTYDLSLDGDLKALEAIPVQGAAHGDRLGTAVSGAGDLDDDDLSDFMFSAPNRDVPGSTVGSTLNNAGEVYVVFGREVNDTPFPDGQCQTVPGGGPRQNFRQCRDLAGNVVPLNVANFPIAATVVGLTLRGEALGERAGVSIAESGNFTDPTAQPGAVGVGEILIGAPFHDIPTGVSIIPGAGRAYVLFGSRDYRPISGEVRSLGLIDDSNTGQVFDGREANANYGISVSSAGNAHDPVGQTGSEILVGANRQDVSLPGVTATNAGETELFFGVLPTGGLPGGQPPPFSPFPFVQPGPFGPQVITAGWWSFTNEPPPAGSIVQFPLCASQPQPRSEPPEPLEPCFVEVPALPDQGVFLFPPYTGELRPPGSVGPFVAAFPLHSPIFYPDKPLALVDRAGNLNLYGSIVPSPGVNLTATFKTPKVKAGAAAVASGNGSVGIFAVDRSGHLIHYHVDGQIIYAVDLTRTTSGPTLAGNLSVQRVNTAGDQSYLVSGRTPGGDIVVYAGNDTAGWGTANLTQLSGSQSPAPRGRVRGRASAAPTVTGNYAINTSGHLIEYRASGRGWLATDITASARGPIVEGDVAVNSFTSGKGRATIELFARSTDGHLIRYYRDRAGWRAEDISAQLGGDAAGQLTGAIVAVSAGVGRRFVYAQAGSQIVEISSDSHGWHLQALSLPTGASSVLGPIAAGSTANSRIVYAYAPNGSLVEYTFNGNAWSVRQVDSNQSVTPGSSLLDLLADLGVDSR